MHAKPSSVPWNTPSLWHEANACLAETIANHRSILADARRETHRARQLLERMAAPMDNLCRRTCPDCTNVCCRRAWVWVDFKDLLFFHLADIAPPERQLLDRQGDRCRYVGASGCRLDRIQRPFVCTWYLCPAQTQCLRKEPVEMQIIQEALQGIKECRQKMEMSFIRAVTMQ